MGNPTNHLRMGGESVRVGDCRVWAEISYLDSSTDYREYLSLNTGSSRQTHDDDLVMLDACSHQKFRIKPLTLWPALLFVPMIIWFLVELAENW
jgi:hypothetical protein